MAREHLSKRAKWQGLSLARGAGAEDVFGAVMEMHLRDSHIEATRKPKDLKGIYGESVKGNPHGIEPEYALHNTRNGKRIYVEMKRQQDAGNTHERACKYFMPGIVESMRVIAKQPPPIVPVWCVFSNGIARSPRYRQEISHWFKGYEAHFLLWKKLQDYQAIVDHFENHIKPLLV